MATASTVRQMTWFVVTATILAATGCATSPAPVVIERPVPVTVTRWVPLDPRLTATAPIPEPRNATGAELLRVARARKADLLRCYADKREAASVQGTESP